MADCLIASCRTSKCHMTDCRTTKSLTSKCHTTDCHAERNVPRQKIADHQFEPSCCESPLRVANFPHANNDTQNLSNFFYHRKNFSFRKTKYSDDKILSGKVLNNKFWGCSWHKSNFEKNTKYRRFMLGFSTYYRCLWKD